MFSGHQPRRYGTRVEGDFRATEGRRWGPTLTESRLAQAAWAWVRSALWICGFSYLTLRFPPKTTFYN